jgi:hypothetical protein
MDYPNYRPVKLSFELAGMKAVPEARSVRPPRVPSAWTENSLASPEDETAEERGVTTRRKETSFPLASAIPFL